MRKTFIPLCSGVLVLLFLGNSCTSHQQTVRPPDTNLDPSTLNVEPIPPAPYNIPPPIEIDIHHVELDLRFDWEKEEVIGKAALTVSASYAKRDTIALDARGFEIKSVRYEGADSTYSAVYEYDGRKIRVVPIKPLAPSDTHRVIIQYIARPSKLENTKGRAITSNQGLYFINPRGEIPNKPRQIWTQGEAECNSGWFPSVDYPHEKFTQEIFLTVDTAYQTISNGKLMYSTINNDGTRTDYWKQSQPHTNYLVMLAIGRFAVTKDTWNGKDVWYYTDPEYALFARQIFGNTPEMLGFYSSLLGYEYPWDKYHQVVVRDFVSGAMENTSAVIHGSFVQQTDREMLDGTHEDVVAHELFHHWFGDLVTCRSWAQLTLNEGFASYGEYLWQAHKYGEEEGRYHLQNDLDAYLSREAETPKPLLRHHYHSPDEVFDTHTYQKGSRTVHMLRMELGDTAFFATLRHYLKKHAFGTADIADLRHSVYEATGRELSWFFDQWYEEMGHPKVEVAYRWDAERKTLSVRMEQVQDERFPVFRMHVPLTVDFGGGKRQTHNLWLSEQLDSFALPLESEPLWYCVDPLGDLLWEVQEQKPQAVWQNQLRHSTSFITRQNALFALEETDTAYLATETSALLADPFWLMRVYMLDLLSTSGKGAPSLKNTLTDMAQRDSHSHVRASALATLDSLYHSDTALNRVFVDALADSSYGVVRTALNVLLERDACVAATHVKPLEVEIHGHVRPLVSRAYARCPSLERADFFEQVTKSATGLDLFLLNNDYTTLALALNDDRVYEGLITALTHAAWKGESWWARQSALQGLEKVEAYYASEIERINAPGDHTTDELERLSYLKNKRASLKAMLEEINDMGEPSDSPFRD